MTGFDFKKWCSENGLKQSTVESLEKNDLDSEDALKLVQADDVATLDLTLGQKKLFMQALKLLSGTDPDQKPVEKHSSESTPVTTKSLANDGGLEDLLKKIGGISMDDPLVTLGATGQPFSTPLERVDNNPQVFLGTQHQPQSKKEVLHHWGDLAKGRSRDGRFYYHDDEDDDDDDDVKAHRSMTSFMVTGCLIMTVIVLVICKHKAQSLINNQKLLAECEELQKNGLQKSERFQKDLNRDVEYKLPHWKKQLAVLDIDVSLYASLHSHSE